jgi:hypothetical protein
MGGKPQNTDAPVLQPAAHYRASTERRWCILRPGGGVPAPRGRSDPEGRDSDFWQYPFERKNFIRITRIASGRELGCC